MPLSEAELLRLKVAVDGMREVKRDMGQVKRDVQSVQAENHNAAASTEAHSRAVRGGTAAVRSQSEAVARARTQMRQFAADQDNATAAVRRQVAAAKAAQLAHRNLAESASQAKISTAHVSATAERNRLETIAKGVAGVAAAYGAVRFAAHGGLEAIRRYEATEGFRRASVANLGLGRGSLLAARTDEFADRQGLLRDSTRMAVGQLAGTGEIQDPKIVLETLKSFMALAQKGGATGEARERAFAQYVQVASSGKLQGDELRSIQEAGVPLRRLLAEAGLGDRIGSQTNPLTFREINAALLQFGKSKEAQGLLQAGADAATASLNRLTNAATDLAVPVGEVLTPAVKSLAGTMTQMAADLDKNQIKEVVQIAVDAGPRVLGVLTLAAIGIKAYTTVLGIRANRAAIDLAKVATSSETAAIALDQLAGAAGVARVAQGATGGGQMTPVYNPKTGARVYGTGDAYGAGFYTQSPDAQQMQTDAAARRAGAQGARGFTPPVWATRPIGGKAGRFIGRVGRGVAGVGGAIAGGMIGEAIGDKIAPGNETARTVGSITGGIVGITATEAAIKGVAGLIGKATAGGAGAASTPAAGFAAGIGAIGLLGVAGLEAVTGVAGTDRSIVNRGVYGFGRHEQDLRADQKRDEYMRVVEELNRMRRSYQRQYRLTRLPTLAELYQASPSSDYLNRLIRRRDQLQGELSGRPNTDSMRRASVDNRMAEANAVAQRGTLP
jgi:tape measure domain-containing protein